MKRRRSAHRESRELAGAVKRMATALVRRAATGDHFALVELHELQAQVQAAVIDAGAQLYLVGDNGPGGVLSWTDIAGELGISRQAARQRFQPRVDELLAERRHLDEQAG